MAKKIDKVLGKSRPGLTPESRENQIVSLAIDLAEKHQGIGKKVNTIMIQYQKEISKAFQEGDLSIVQKLEEQRNQEIEQFLIKKKMK